MNEEDLRLMVARARDAEGSPPSPPPGLVDQARTAARRGRRVVTAAAGCVVAAAIVVGVGLPRLLDADDEPTADEPLTGVDSGELDAHGGPCPPVLPAPIDDKGGHGFGTSTPAERDPRFTTPDSAWVCQYVARSIGRTESGGTEFEWKLSHTPRRLDDARLGPVEAKLHSIANTGFPQACTDDLGPRWLLVTATDGDLTGVAVDGYGCGQVRLTDNPFLTAPGDPQEGGTVSGMLNAPGLAATLEDWWNTSPADAESSSTPDELRVTCTDDGPQVEQSTVAATPAGVVLVVDSTMSEGSYLTYTSVGPSGGDRLDKIADGATYAFPPGQVTLGCASPPDMDETGTVTVEVTDPFGYWRSSTLADFGCPPGGAQPSWAVGDGTGPTAQAAVDDLLAQLADTLSSEGSDFTAEPAPTGYSGAAAQTWVALNRGRPAFSVMVTGSEGSFTATPDVLCGRG